MAQRSAQINKPGVFEVSLLLLVAAIWGSAFAAMKVVVPELGALWTAAFRVTIGFFGLLPFYILFQREFPQVKKLWSVIGIVALLNMVIPFIPISWAMNHVEAGIGALLMGTTPIIAIVMGHFLTSDEKIDRLKLVAVFLAISGIAVLAGPEAVSGFGSSALWAQIAIILGSSCYVMAGFIMRRIVMKPIAFTTIALGLGSLMLLSISLAVSGLPTVVPGKIAIGALIWLGLFPTGFAYVMRYFLVQRVGVSTFALSMNTVPVFGILFGAVLLGEVVEWTTLAALALVLSGLMVARTATNRTN